MEKGRVNPTFSFVKNEKSMYKPIAMELRQWFRIALETGGIL
jgi:hypothetical protein